MNGILCIALTPAWQETRLFEAIGMGCVNRSLSVRRFPAGKGVNVAKVLRTLGARPVLAGFAGGPTGALCRRALRNLGMRAAFVTTESPTRVCVTLLERRTGRVTELVEEAAPPRPAEWRALMGRLSSAIPRAGVVTLTGALMPGARPGIYRKIAGMASAAGARLVLDSQGEALLAALSERPALAKLNVRELETTLGARANEPAGIVAGARRLLSIGAACVVVTHGRRGAWLVSGDGCWRFRSPAVPVCNPVGSGDAMTAGIALALARGRSMHDAARLGVACGAANAMTTEAGTVRLSDVRRLLPLVVTEFHGDMARGRRVRP